MSSATGVAPRPPSLGRRAADFYDQRARSPLSAVHFVLHFAIAGWVGFLGIQLFLSIQSTVPANCGIVGNYLPNWPLAAIGLFALFVGRYFGFFRGRQQFPQDPKESRFAGQLSMALVFLALTVIWFFEAMGTARVPANPTGSVTFEPITFYVRCAVFQDMASNDRGLLAGGLIATVCFLAGHWLWAWHPALRNDHPEEEEDATFT